MSVHDSGCRLTRSRVLLVPRACMPMRISSFQFAFVLDLEIANKQDSARFIEGSIIEPSVQLSLLSKRSCGRVLICTAADMESVVLLPSCLNLIVRQIV